MKQNDTIKLCIPFRVWESAHMAAATDDIRYYLNGIHVIGNRVESTNGHIAYLANIKDCEIPGFFDDVFINKSGFIISPKNKIPKWSKKNQIAYVVITINEKDADIDYISLYGERVSSDIAVVVDGRFPNIPKLISGIRKNKIKNDSAIGMNADYLSVPAKMLHHCKYPIVKMEMFGDESAVIFTLKRDSLREAKEMLVVMPAKL